MTGAAAAPLLLARDREQLDRAARLIRDRRPGYFVIVCPPGLRPAAIQYLGEQTGREIAGPLRVEDHDTMVTAVRAVDGKPVDAVDSISVGAPPVDVWIGLNWVRENLVKGGQALLWLDSVEDLRAMREHAPDAYSYRQALLILQGEGERAPEWDEGGEPPDIKALRLLYELPRAPEERAKAALELAEALRDRSRFDQADSIAKEGLALIPGGEFKSNRDRVTRTRLYNLIAWMFRVKGRTLDAFRCYEAELSELGDDMALSLPGGVTLRLGCSAMSPLKADRRSVDDALRSMYAVTPHGPLGRDYQEATESAEERGRFADALDYCARYLAMTGSLWDRAACFWTLARIREAMGHLRQAQHELTGAERASSRVGTPAFAVDAVRAALLVDRAELAAAESLLSSIRSGLVTNEAILSSLRAAIHCERGDTGCVIRIITDGLSKATVEHRDRHVFDEARDLIRFIARLHAAGAASEVDLVRSLEIIDSAGRVLIDYAQGDPPWYDVLVPGLHAQLLYLFGTRHEEAIAAASEAVALARSRWKQALPLSLRILVQCLARAGRWAEMEPAVGEASQSARDEDHLRELATIQAYDLARLVHVQAPVEAVQTALSDLRATFTEMDAPRVEGETWLEVAPFFPLTTKAPDLIEIADHVHDLFLEMPMPEPAARCMEWLGDLHAVRGDRRQAESCYRLSLGALDRYGLLLRRPLVAKKLEAITTS